MNKKIAGLLLLSAVGFQAQAVAADQPLMCFGNEPFWSLDLTEPGVAQFSTPDGKGPVYQGTATRLDFLGETLWRGSPSEGSDLVAWLKDGACSDTMSDTVHPVIARVAHPDGRFLAGCCRTVAAADAGSALEATNWRLTQLSGIEPAALAGMQRPVTIRFEAGQVQGFSGCNNFSGGYRMEAERLEIGQVASTMMACMDPGMAIENAFQIALAGSFNYSIDGDQLTLTPESGETLRFQREAPPRLDGVTWKVTGYNNNRQAVVGVIEEASIRMVFREGEVSGSAGCNSFRATYETTDDRIQFGPAITTRRACEDALMAQEREFLAALESAVTWRIDGNVLDMHRADSERAIWAITE